MFQQDQARSCGQSCGVGDARMLFGAARPSFLEAADVLIWHPGQACELALTADDFYGHFDRLFDVHGGSLLTNHHRW
ncbi:hypothetical protein [Hydrogenophaga sp. PBC]|uniref:hypothetical protein n=1 Tax=Hydrogenophaga sp. PBC TaxID=795665 RepID=UPI0011E00269|nr:hypothetical protein [Hydrogenophaga sp. PBC]